MEERKSEIQISSPIFYRYSSYLGLIVRLYEEVLGKESYSKVYLGILASLELMMNDIPEEAFGFYCTNLHEAGTERIIMDADGSRTLIPEFDPNDKMCEDCRELVDIALAQYAFIASKDGPNPLKDYLGAIFSYSGIGVEGVDDGYHLKQKDFIPIYEKMRAQYGLGDEQTSSLAKVNLKQRLDQLVRIFEGESA